MQLVGYLYAAYHDARSLEHKVHMTLVYAEKGASETTVPVHQTTSQTTAFLNCLHRYENPKLYIASNVR
jgi:hypothetical protein